MNYYIQILTQIQNHNWITNNTPLINYQLFKQTLKIYPKALLLLLLCSLITLYLLFYFNLLEHHFQILRYQVRWPRFHQLLHRQPRNQLHRPLYSTPEFQHLNWFTILNQSFLPFLELSVLVDYWLLVLHQLLTLCSYCFDITGCDPLYIIDCLFHYSS